VSIVLVDGKEPSEDTDLVLEEAVDDILAIGGTSFTMTFASDDAPVPMVSIEAIELQDASDQVVDELHESFRVVGGAMIAADPAAVYERIARHSIKRSSMRVVAVAVDAEGRTHSGAVPFQVGRAKLAVTLEAPPSNPSLPVSNITVKVSVMGTDVAVSRVTDADGRFEIDSLPEAMLAFDSVVVVDGRYYYGQEAMPLCGDRSVTLVMRNVADVVKGVRPLRADPPCPPVPRR
jgi:hypothetical protein